MWLPWFDVDAAVAEMSAVSRQLDALFAQRGLDGRHGLRTLEGELGVREDADAWVLSVDLPGVAPADVKVAYADGALTVRAERKWAAPPDTTVKGAERSSTVFDRTARLSDRVDPERIEAAFEHGVLTVRLPKRAATGPRAIPVAA